MCRLPACGDSGQADRGCPGRALQSVQVLREQLHRGEAVPAKSLRTTQQAARGAHLPEPTSAAPPHAPRQAESRFHSPSAGALACAPAGKAEPGVRPRELQRASHRCDSAGTLVSSAGGDRRWPSGRCHEPRTANRGPPAERPRGHQVPPGAPQSPPDGHLRPGRTAPLPRSGKPPSGRALRPSGFTG